MLLGEPPVRLHPVCWMGSAISALRRRAPRRGRLGPFLFGLALALGLPALAAGLTAALISLPTIGPLLAVWLLTSSFSVRALGEAGLGVAGPLEAGDLDGARSGLRALCSRDASALSASDLSAGAVESLAENSSDSLVAPLFWLLVAGVPGALAYRAVNTLDAMIGYHGETEWLGKASARLDDLANLAPARITALLLLVAGGLRGASLRGGLSALWRDRRQTESPNAGWPMAAVAGLLGLRLEKAGAYALNPAGRPAEPRDIAAAWRICRLAMGLGAAATLALLAARAP